MRVLGLAKERAELVGSRLKEKSVLDPETSIYLYKTRDEQFAQFFRQKEDLVHCHDTNRLLK